MSQALNSIMMVVLLAIAACAPRPPDTYEAQVDLPNPPSVSAVAHLAPSEACAALSGDPLEAGARGRGAFISQIDFRSALRICDAAIANGRGAPVDYYNRARALQAGLSKVSEAEHAAWVEEGLAAYEKAADEGHPHAMMFLAELRLLDLPNRPRDAELSAQLRRAAFEKFGKPGAWWPETRLYLGLIGLRDENFELMPITSASASGSSRLRISSAAHAGMARYVMHEYDLLRCDEFDRLTPGNPRGEVCNMFLEVMANNGMVVPAATLAVREYNSGVRAAQRHNVRHNDARTGYANGKYWAQRALEGTIDPNENALQLARDVRDRVIGIETRIANQDRALAAIVGLFANAPSNRSAGAASRGSVDTSHLTDPRRNGTCLGAGLAGDGAELFASGC